MAGNEIQKLREQSREGLAKELASEQKRLQELRFDLARGKVKNSSLVRTSRKRIARLMTLIHEKERNTEPKENSGKEV